MAPTLTATPDPATKADASIPLIPLTPLLPPTTPTPSPSPEALHTATHLLTTLRQTGFLYLTHFHDLIPASLITAVFAHSARFFALPQEQKDTLGWTTPRANRGYVCLGREKVSSGLTREEVGRERAGGGLDMKESFEVGREGEEGCANRWFDGDDDDDDGFRGVMREFFARCLDVHRALMRGVALGMGLDEGFFDGFLRRGDNTLRLLHYPAVSAGGFEGGKRVRAGAHSDFGSLTLLFQDGRGGLQVEPPGGKGGWVDVEPREDTIVVNAGDMLARWSNDTIRSTKHRVVEPPLKAKDGEGYPPRYSVAYFCNPDFDRWIEALPGTWEGDKGGKKYEGVNSGEYLVQRLSATY